MISALSIVYLVRYSETHRLFYAHLAELGEEHGGCKRKVRLRIEACVISRIVYISTTEVHMLWPLDAWYATLFYFHCALCRFRCAEARKPVQDLTLLSSANTPESRERGRLCEYLYAVECVLSSVVSDLTILPTLFLVLMLML